MKFRLGVMTILLSTAAIIGLIHITLNPPSSSDISINKSEDDPSTPKPVPTGKKRIAKSVKTGALSTPKEPVPKINAHPNLSPKDKAIITNIANLDADKMAKEIKALSEEISQSDLFLQLESGQLSPALELKAKEKLERFALLNLEAKRRKHLDTEPELKDPLLAHADSLFEIRQALNDP